MDARVYGFGLLLNQFDQTFGAMPSQRSSTPACRAQPVTEARSVREVSIRS